jgi:hypothetical protein
MRPVDNPAAVTGLGPGKRWAPVVLCTSANNHSTTPGRTSENSAYAKFAPGFWRWHHACGGKG